MMAEKTIVVGAGPAGLAATYSLAQKGEQVICLELDKVVGGISRTVEHNGFRFDIGGHRFFTKINRVNDLWKEILGDDFLRRPRLSRMYYNHRFFNYPIKPLNAIIGLGFLNSLFIFGSFIASKIRPYPKELTFEQWVSNRFGKRLYQIFFKTYTEKVWGIPCSEIQAEWAAQRIKGLSLATALKTALFGDKQKKIKTLIQEFNYPRLGPGQMYETMAAKAKQTGAELLLEHKVIKWNSNGGRIVSVTAVDAKGAEHVFEGENFISSVPICELAKSIQPQADSDVIKAASNLKYRSLITVNLMMNRKECFPDTWIYIHSPEVRMGRIQCFKNWSPYMVPNENQSSLGLEYFCNSGDEMWNTKDEDLIKLGKAEIAQLGLADPADVFDAFVIRMPNTYPVYSLDYCKNLEVVKAYICGFANLQCIGRNGLFKYNNMDHSIFSALLAVDNLFGAHNDIWSMNTKEEYHEEISR
jgi:protoporphyrinogen oxidase